MKLVNLITALAVVACITVPILAGCSDNQPTYYFDNGRVYVLRVETNYEFGGNGNDMRPKSYKVVTSSFNIITDSIYKPGDTLTFTVNRYKP